MPGKRGEKEKKWWKGGKQKLWPRNDEKLEEELVRPMTRRRIMRVIPGMKRIQTKPTMTKTHCNSERRGPGEATSDNLTKCHYIYTRI